MDLIGLIGLISPIGLISLIGPIEAYPTTDSQPRAHRILDLLHLLAPSPLVLALSSPTPYSAIPTLLH